MPPSIKTRPQRLRRLSLSVQALALLGGVAPLLLLPLFWSQPDWVARVALGEWGLKAVQLDSGARLGGLLATALPVGVSLWALWQVWAMFGCYARGELLTPQPARHLRRLGWAMIMLAAALPLGHSLIVLALTWANPPGQRLLIFALSSQHYLSLLFGLMLLALGTVLTEAARLARENAEFI
ncbi:DUF2975 domain-containing protein [Paucibacter sp. XJ19-41]|uniref:DUF2975 domain-containing protein n=1 Tax=Paucibacter sp. XJ19-41 TaxID=2927824 RepID=UPI00234AF4C1|nr:DUF2975 domain-containing protein [Paucibacter sp. XJ19-41]MDC6170330.1 DUF2975 domain-containing protein [Paucibacter sp. XJ19-41]